MLILDRWSQLAVIYLLLTFRSETCMLIFPKKGSIFLATASVKLSKEKVLLIESGGFIHKEEAAWYGTKA
jgi:hypothetical protein